MSAVIEVTSDRGRRCDEILRALPDWFGIEQAIVDYVAAVEQMPMLAVAGGPGGGIVGFLSYRRMTEATCEIHVMGVMPAHHRTGLGRELVEAAAGRSRALGCRLLSVKTLAASRPDPFYDRTREFYQSLDFLPVEVFPTLWDAANPCLLMVRILR